MTTVAFDAENKLHHDLFNSFKKDLVSDIYSKDHLYCQYDDYIDELEVVALTIALEELGFDEDFDEYCVFAIQNPSPKTFVVIAGLEFLDYESEDVGADFMKLCGQILIENDKTVIFDIDHTTVDYSSNREFDKAKQAYPFK